MTRGIWRWWENKDGVDVWWAHIERRHGEWSDILHSEYDRDQHQPSFWDLPLKEDYFARLRNNDPEVQFRNLQHKITLPIIIGAVILVALVFLLFLMGAIFRVHIG